MKKPKISDLLQEIRKGVQEGDLHERIARLRRIKERERFVLEMKVVFGVVALFGIGILLHYFVLTFIDREMAHVDLVEGEKVKDTANPDEIQNILANLGQGVGEAESLLQAALKHHKRDLGDKDQEEASVYVAVGKVATSVQSALDQQKQPKQESQSEFRQAKEISSSLVDLIETMDTKKKRSKQTERLDYQNFESLPDSLEEALTRLTALAR